MDIIEKAKKHFFANVKIGQDPWDLLTHVPEAERWADVLLKEYPQVDREIIALAIWLHDAAYYVDDKIIDHAVKSEEDARRFLTKEGYDREKLERVCHCVRSHRNKDVKPQTLEAKLICLIDSVSHFTYAPYIAMTRDGRGEQALEKLERDYRDLASFSQVEKELKPIYEAWKVLISELVNTDWYQRKTQYPPN